jgi:hypothetical protein
MRKESRAGIEESIIPAQTKNEYSIDRFDD